MTTLFTSLLFLYLSLITLSLSSECHPGTIANYDLKNSAGQDVNPLRCLYGIGKVGSAVWDSVILSRYPGMYVLAPNQIHLPWGTGEHCGKCFELSGPKGSILGVVMDTTTQTYRSPVLPLASDSYYLHWDVINEAGNAVSLIGDNTWQIMWHQVPCPWSGNIKYTLTGVYTQTLYFYFFDFLDALSTFHVCSDVALTKCTATTRYGIRFFTGWGTFSSTKTTAYLKLTSQNGQVATGTLTAAQAQKADVVYTLTSNFKSSVTANSNPCSQHLDTEPIFDNTLGVDFAGGFKWGSTGSVTTGTCPSSTDTCLIYTYPGTAPFVHHYYAPVPAKQFSSLSIRAYASEAITLNWLINWSGSFGSIALTFPAKQWVTKTIEISTTSKSGAWVVKSDTVISQIVAQGSSSASGKLYIQILKLVPTTAALATFDSTLTNRTPWKVNGVTVGAETAEELAVAKTDAGDSSTVVAVAAATSEEVAGSSLSTEDYSSGSGSDGEVDPDSTTVVEFAITDASSPTDTLTTPVEHVPSTPEDQSGTIRYGVSSAGAATVLFGYIGMIAVVLVIVILSLVVLLVVLLTKGTQRKIETI